MGVYICGGETFISSLLMLLRSGEVISKKDQVDYVQYDVKSSFLQMTIPSGAATAFSLLLHYTVAF